MPKQPRKGDTVFDQMRMDTGSYPNGKVVRVLKDYEDPDNTEVLVLFDNSSDKHKETKGRYVLAYDNQLFYRIDEGDMIWTPTTDWQTLDNSLFHYLFIGEEEEFVEIKERETYPIADFEGTWSSVSDGGHGRWEL